ncbi:MAG: CHRD domain-containing protein [Proteobacteria bacterium]|nr:CHRD domain-containing protein [Pseudomonadota bacterium]
MRLLPAAFVAAVAFANPAFAKTLTFRATLTGVAPPTTTGSPARGKAVIKVDTASKKVSVELDVSGITLDQLNDDLVAKPVGPIHFHVYRTADDVELILPLPYGPNYRATKTGFHVTVRGYDYAAGAKLINGGASFDEFVNGLRGQRIVLNVHTDKFPDGEISGTVMTK